MAHVRDDQAQALISLFGARVQAHGDKAPEVALDALLDAERFRQGSPDATGAVHVLALTQGALLRHEYDLSTHGHWDGWEIGAVVVDIQRLILINQEHGFPVGDAALRAVAGTLQETYPSGKVVRIHSDAFAVLLPPSAERVMEVQLDEQTRAALRTGVARRLVDAGGPSLELDYSLALLHLTLARPSHWQVLGPLVWAECERALTLVRTQQMTGVQRRRIELDAAVPLPG